MRREALRHIAAVQLECAAPDAGVHDALVSGMTAAFAVSTLGRDHRRDGDDVPPSGLTGPGAVV
jgi:hypothetical protein